MHTKHHESLLVRIRLFLIRRRTVVIDQKSHVAQSSERAEPCEPPRPSQDGEALLLDHLRRLIRISSPEGRLYPLQRHRILRPLRKPSLLISDEVLWSCFRRNCRKPSLRADAYDGADGAQSPNYSLRRHVGDARKTKIEGRSAWLWPAHTGKREKKSWDVPTVPDKASEACAHLRQLAQAPSTGHRPRFFNPLPLHCRCCSRTKHELPAVIEL